MKVYGIWILPRFQVRGSFIEVTRLVDELATFGMRLRISFTGRKVYIGGDLGIKAYFSMGSNLQLSIFGKTQVV
jgi:hypothetical protein